jgi:hypothetical protein
VFSHGNETRVLSSVPKKEKRGVTLVHAQCSLRTKCHEKADFLWTEFVGVTVIAIQ